MSELKTFILQVDKTNGIPLYDFVYKAYESIDFINWMTANEMELPSFNFDLVHLGQLENWEGSFSEKRIPVGSVEFIHTYMEKVGLKPPKPLNVPEELFSFAGRKIVNGSLDAFSQVQTNSPGYLPGVVFIKSNDFIKDHRNDFYSKKPTFACQENESFQMSERIDIEKEFRLFVFNRKIQGVFIYVMDDKDIFTPYSGLDKSFCCEVVKAYKDSPIAYTLDVGVKSSGENFVLECHNFYSCGLYGWDDPVIYLNMLTGWWKEFVNKGTTK